MRSGCKIYLIFSSKI